MEANRFTWVGPGNWWLVPQRRALQRVRALEPGLARVRESQVPEWVRVRELQGQQRQGQGQLPVWELWAQVQQLVRELMQA